MNISIDTILAIAIGIASYMAFFNIVTALVGAAFRIPIQRIQFGFPPSFRLFHIGRTEIRLSPLMLAGHVKFFAPEDDRPYAPWPVRALISITAPIAAIATCAIPLGLQAFNEAAMAWPQMLGVLIDYSMRLNLDAALSPAFQSGGLIAAASVVAIKAAMFNLLPLPFLNGGAFLLALFEGLTGKPTDAFVQRIMPVALIVAITLPIVLLLRIALGT